VTVYRAGFDRSSCGEIRLDLAAILRNGKALNEADGHPLAAPKSPAAETVGRSAASDWMPDAIELLALAEICVGRAERVRRRLTYIMLKNALIIPSC